MKLLCLCPTFGRPRSLIENTLALFKAQTYPLKDRKLLILDDGGTFEPQAGPDWELWSTPGHRYESIAAKYAAMVPPFLHFDGLVVWDDDDLYLPGHLAAIAATLKKHPWAHPSRILSDYGNQLHEEETGGRFHGALALTTETYREIGGWPQTKQADFDQQMLGRLREFSPPGDLLEVNPGPTYIYRWESTGVHHCSGDMLSPENTEWYDKAANLRSAFLQQPISGGLRPTFDTSTRSLLAMTGNQGLLLKHPCVDGRDPVQPIRDYEVKGLHHPEYNLNGSIARYLDQIFLAYRSGWERARIRLAVIQQKPSGWLAVVDRELALPGGPEDSFEDPRLTLDNDTLTLLLAYTRAWYEADGLHTEESLAHFRDDVDGHPVRYHGANQIEKNWLHFAADGQSYVIYSISPLRILRVYPSVSGFEANDEYLHTWRSPWPDSILRGGAPPVYYDGHLYVWYHAICEVRGPRVYTGGVAQLEAEPPFRILAITPSAIMTPPTQQYKSHPIVVYPRGMVVDNDRWLVSYGYQDHQVRIAEFDPQDILARLVSVACE